MTRSIVTPTKPTNPAMKFAGKALQDVTEKRDSRLKKR